MQKDPKDMSHKHYPKVGIGIYILNDKNQILLLLEKRTDGKAWAPPGGHLEFSEDFLDCVKREAKEETSLEVLRAELWAINNNITKPDFHYVNLEFLVESFQGKPRITEPHKCEKMKWFDLNNLPTPLLVPTANFFKNNPKCLCRSGKKYLECHGRN